MDTDHRAEEAWVLGVQRKLYQQSKANPDDAWRDLWGWLTDLRMIRHSWRRVASNKGKRSAGIDGITVKHIQIHRAVCARLDPYMPVPSCLDGNA